MVLGVHGALELAPWLRHAYADGSLEEDVFSLVVKRATAYGLSSFDGQSPPGVQWDHHDAGGDWSPDATVREQGWMQIGLPGMGGAQRLPVAALVRVLTDALRRVGRLRFTGLHAVVPMHLATDIRADLAAGAGWFALADPGASVMLTVSVSADERLSLPTRASQLADAASLRAHGCLTVEPSPACRNPPGLAPVLTGRAFAPAEWHQEQTFHCQAHEWSADMAAWVLEIFIDALRETAPTAAPAVFTVSTPVID
jgi:hypothetical protein